MKKHFYFYQALLCSLFFPLTDALACSVCLTAIADYILPPIYLWNLIAVTWILSNGFVLSAKKMNQRLGLKLVGSFLLVLVLVIVGGGIFGFGIVVLLFIPALVTFFRSMSRKIQKESPSGALQLKIVGIIHLIAVVFVSGIMVHTHFARTPEEFIVQWQSSSLAGIKFEELERQGEKALPAYRYIHENAGSIFSKKALDRINTIVKEKGTETLEKTDNGAAFKPSESFVQEDSKDIAPKDSNKAIKNSPRMQFSIRTTADICFPKTIEAKTDTVGEADVRGQTHDLVVFEETGPRNSVYLFDPQFDKMSKKLREEVWKEYISEWLPAMTVPTVGDGSILITSGAFAQSFIPHSKTIAAVEIALYPAFSPGWWRLDICPDENGRPSDQVLARCWVYRGVTCPIPHGTSTPFDIPDIDVDSEKTYWICFREYPERKGKTTINYKFQKNSIFSEGKLFKSWAGEPSETEDIIFRVLSSTPPIPGMCRANGEALDTLPMPELANLPWNIRDN